MAQPTLDRGNDNDYHMHCTPALKPVTAVPFPLLISSAPGLAPVIHIPSIGLSSLGFSCLALLSTALSVVGFYAASAHCRWARLRRAGQLGRELGTVAAVAATWLWMADLGVGAGLVVALCGWMGVATLLPLLAAWHRPATVPARSPR